MMANSHLTNLRTAIEWLKKLDEILITDTEVDPHLEYAGIQKRLDGGPALLFEKVKGYPNGRLANNFYSTMERVARFFEVEDPRKFKFKAQQAILHPIPPREVKEAPSQEVVVAKDLDVWQVVPMISHARTDPGRTLGGGNTLVTGQYFWGGTHIGYNRMNFRGKDFSSFQISPGSHMDQIATAWYRKGPIPMTINIGVPPACTMLAGAGFMYMVLPRGSDELGVAGALQGFPVDIVKARTVDAYAIAEAEYVVEGYLDMTQKVWESPIAEAENKQGVHPFHPEWAGYMGKAYRTYKFQATAITHRKDRPIYYGLIVHGMDDHFIDVSMREAAFLEMAERISPGFVVDVHIPMGMTDWGGAIFQVRKRRARDEGLQRNILSAALSISLGMRLGIVVDEDSLRGRVRPDFPAGRALLGRGAGLDPEQHPVLRGDGHRRHRPLPVPGCLRPGPVRGGDGGSAEVLHRGPDRQGEVVPVRLRQVDGGARHLTAPAGIARGRPAESRPRIP
ncbi:MAG: UbiD family decarboxylase [Deltaproteobacteria bacterium]|nr:UbiD family decarboxylase [Deltaproteobacteria bacterium]